MKRFLLALSLLFATPCWAQSTADLFGAGKGLEMVGGVLVQAVGAVQLCGLGDEAPWRRAVEAINRRHAHCIAQASGWKALTDKPDVLAGTFVFDLYWKTDGAKARAQGVAAYCRWMPWKLALEPATATEEAKAKFLRERPQVTRKALDEFISLMDYAQALGEDTRWIEAPCTDFWPAMKG